MKSLKKKPHVRFLIIAISVVALTGCITSDDEKVGLDVKSVPEEGGYVTFANRPGIADGLTQRKKGTEVQLKANAEKGYLFDRWDGDHLGSENPITVVMDKYKKITAQFIARYPLEISTIGEGTVTETIIQNKSTDYDSGTNVQLEAIPATGWNFLEWQDDLQGSQNPETIVIDAAKTVTAVFDQAEFNVQVSAEGPGTASVDPEKDEYVYNETVQFSAMPNPGNQFLGWFNEDGFEMLEADFEYQITEDLDITAFFNSVEGAFVVVTVNISSTDGTVDIVVFNVFNFLLDSIVLIGADVENEEGEEIGNLRFGSPPTIPSRSGIEVQATLDDEDAPDVETVQNWIFKWLFDFDGDRYEKAQQVGEPASKAKQLHPLKSVETEESISVEIEF